MANYCGRCLAAREYICDRCLGCESGECCSCDPPGSDWEHIGSRQGKIALSRWVRGKQKQERDEVARVGVPESLAAAGNLGARKVKPYAS